MITTDSWTKDNARELHGWFSYQKLSHKYLELAVHSEIVKSVIYNSPGRGEGWINDLHLKKEIIYAIDGFNRVEKLGRCF